MNDGAVVIAAVGFEDRTLAFVETVPRTPGAALILCRYDPEETSSREADLVPLFADKGFAVEGGDQLVFDRFAPDPFADQLQGRLIALNPRHVWIDISSMSKMLLLLVLEVCRDLNHAVSIFYAEAHTYAPTRKSYEQARSRGLLHQPSIQLYTGVGEVVRAGRLSSVGMQGSQLAAIMFMSFNELLTQALVTTLSPSRLLLINGKPPVHAWREEATAWIHEKLLREWPEDDNPVGEAAGRSLPKRVVSTLDYRETFEMLLNLYDELASDYRIVMAPTGSKMQTVGAFFARSVHRDVHVEYPTPKGYLKLFSKGRGPAWTTHFGPLGDFTNRLRDAELAAWLPQTT